MKKSLGIALALTIIVVSVGCGAVGERAAPTRALPRAPSCDVTATTDKNGQRVLLLTPARGTGSASPLVMYFHASGNTEEGVLRDGGINGVVDALCAAGYIIASSFARGENWGSPGALLDYVSLYDQVTSQYQISRTVFLSQSMGGLAGLSLLAKRELPAQCWLGIYPVTNLRNLFDLGTYREKISAAYDLAPDGSDYDLKTAGSDPALLPGEAFEGLRLRFYASPEDTDVPQAENTDRIAALAAPYAAGVEVIQATGEHGDRSHFRPDEVVAFFDSCR